MADLMLHPAPVLVRPRAVRGAHALGLNDGEAGVRFEVRTPAIVAIAARRGRTEALRAAVRQLWDVALPAAPVFVQAPWGRLSWAGPAQWMLMADTADDRLDAAVAAAFPGNVSVTAQGDGRFVVRLSGPRARDTLIKGVPVDLHDRAFPVGTTALTVASHINMQLWRLAPEIWEAAVFRGYADSFADWLFEAGAAFGIHTAP